MNHRFLALALAGTLTLGMLTACGGTNGNAETPAAGTTPPVAESLTPAPESSAPVTEESPDAAPESSAPVEESQTPSSKPSDTPASKPSDTPASKPSATPTPTPDTKPQTDVVATVWAGISKLELPSLMAVDDATLSALYGISASDLVSYQCHMPMMAVHATEFFVAEVKDGKMDAVKAGIAKRQADLVAQWSQYLPDQLELVENYKLVTSGNYILFAVSEHADAAVTAFNTYAK